jgi:uncharacterized protein (TIGR00369 family)
VNGAIHGNTLEPTRLRELREQLDNGLAAGIGVGHSLGILLESLGDGHTVWTLTPSPAAANAMYTVHGGVIATLMDTAMGSAVYTLLPPGAFYTTLELKANFIRSVKLDGDRIVCEGKAIHVGRRTATAEARVVDSAGNLVAHAVCTCMVFPADDGEPS